MNVYLDVYNVYLDVQRGSLDSLAYFFKGYLLRRERKKHAIQKIMNIFSTYMQA